MYSGAKSVEYCGRTFDTKQIKEIQETVKLLPNLSRKELAKTLSEHLEWYTATGACKTTACLHLLEKLESMGIVTLPAVHVEMRRIFSDEISRVQTERTAPREAVQGRLSALGPVRLEVVHGREQETLFAEYLQRYHYLGYQQPIGCFVRYFIVCVPGVVGCLMLAGAAQKIEARDRWIRWTTRQRQRNLPWVINNSRFLLLPWVQVQHLASHALGQLARRVRADWEERWGYAPVLMETCVDPAHYTGTCYRAAGWTEVGLTTGRGLCRPGRQYKTTPKLFFVKALVQDACALLCGSTLQGRREE